MKTFHDYLAESVKEYTYRIKTPSVIDDNFLDEVERICFKYDIVGIMKPKKTMAQKNPLDFPNRGLMEIWMVDLVTNIPVSSMILRQELRGALKLSDADLIVRANHEPLEIATNEIQGLGKLDKDAADKGLLPASHLSSKPEYAEYDYDKDPDPSYGDGYNKKFLNYLAQTSANREHLEVTPATTEEPTKFAWLSQSKPEVEAGDFNAGIDTVKPVAASSKKAGAKAEAPIETNNAGNFDDTDRKFSRLYKDKNGKRVTLRTTTRDIRED